MTAAKVFVETVVFAETRVGDETTERVLFSRSALEELVRSVENGR